MVVILDGFADVGVFDHAEAEGFLRAAGHPFFEPGGIGAGEEGAAVGVGGFGVEGADEGLGGEEVDEVRMRSGCAIQRNATEGVPYSFRLVTEADDAVGLHEEARVARGVVDEVVDFDEAAVFAAGGAAEGDFEGEEAVELGSQKLMSRGVPDGVPLSLDPADDGGVVTGDFDLGCHEQAVASTQADANLRIVAHEVGRFDRERRQLVDAEALGVGCVEARDFGLRAAEEGVAEGVEEVHGDGCGWESVGNALRGVP